VHQNPTNLLNPHGSRIFEQLEKVHPSAVVETAIDVQRVLGGKHGDHLA